MLARIIHAKPAALLNRDAAGRREKRVSHFVLRPDRRGLAQFRGPPTARRTRSLGEQTDPARALRLPPSGVAVDRALVAHEAGEFVAEFIDAMFQSLIEHVADHDHAASRPLSHAAEIRMIELRLGSIAERERVEHRESRLEAHPVAARDLCDHAKTVWREIRHRLFSIPGLRMGAVYSSPRKGVWTGDKGNMCSGTWVTGWVFAPRIGMV